MHKGQHKGSSVSLVYLGLSPFPVTVTTRIIPFLEGNPNLNLHLLLSVTGKGNNPRFTGKFCGIPPGSHTWWLKANISRIGWWNGGFFQNVGNQISCVKPAAMNLSFLWGIHNVYVYIFIYMYIDFLEKVGNIRICEVQVFRDGRKRPGKRSTCGLPHGVSMVCHVGRAAGGQSECSGRTEGSHFLHWLPVRSSNESSVMDTGMFIKKYYQKEQVFSSPVPLGLISIFIVSRGFVGYDKLCHKQPMWTLKGLNIKKQVVLLMVQKL